ncbi:MAG: ABC transporter ATP-binding protein [Spirochaetaceae bacterium]|nr:ABC transporter ATP-binding protein [Spirochaetaceae bacterium]
MSNRSAATTLDGPHRTSKSVPAASLRRVVTEIIWPRRWLLLLGLALIVVNRLTGLVLPGASKYLIDDVIGAGDTALLGPLLLAVCAAVLVQGASSFLLTRLLSVQAQHLISTLRARVQRHLLRLPVAFFDNNQTGALVSRVMTDAEGVRNLVGTGLVHLVGGALTTVVVLVLLLRISVPMTLYTFLPLAVFGAVSGRAFALIRPIFRQRGAINAEVTGRLTEALAGIRVVKGFHAEPHEERVFGAGVERIFANVRRSLTATSLVTSGGTVIMGLSAVLIMGVGGSLILRGAMTVGDFVSFSLYLGFMVTPIVQMSRIGTEITEAFAGLDRIEEVMARQPEGNEPERTVTLERIDGHIRFDHVSFAYQEGEQVLHDVCLEAPADTMTALVGSSGSGKTTIAGLAASFLAPDSGTVSIDGHDLATVRLDSFRRYLGVVLQDEFLFAGTIRENILFARPGAGEEDLMRAVRAAHVIEFSERLELGLDTMIGERGVKLSGGQRQRVALARAILADPRVLILDEATSSLDNESEAFIQESLAQLMKGRTTLVIAHRLSTIRRADQILVVEGGRIVERGRHDDLIAAAGRYQRLYEYQARI